MERELSNEWQKAGDWLREESDTEEDTADMLSVGLLAGGYGEDEEGKKLIRKMMKDDVFCEIICKLALLALNQTIVNNDAEDERKEIAASN